MKKRKNTIHELAMMIRQKCSTGNLPHVRICREKKMNFDQANMNISARVIHIEGKRSKKNSEISQLNFNMLLSEDEGNSYS